MTGKSKRWRYLPILILVLGLALFFSTDLKNYLSLNALQKHYQWLNSAVATHFVFASLIFFLLYIVVVTFSIPAASLLTITAGFLFGQWFGTLYVVIAATIGASLVFLAARFAFHDLLFKRTGQWLEKMRADLNDNAFNYLLTIRLLPIFPFFIVNIVPAFLNIRLATFSLATFLGIIPGSFIYVSLGTGLETIFQQKQIINFAIIFQPDILLPIIGLAVISIAPVMFKKIKALKQ